MAESSRIEDLRKRYHENPRRFFAPLANEYRKGGFLDRAVLLCEKHLNEQPENMNGLVVYGQVLFESGKQEEARAPFEAALKLDPENLIALRHLGDIARTGGDVELARSWYHRVLEVDRRNDDVLDILEQLNAGDGGAAPAPTAPSASSLVSVAPNVSVSGGEVDLGNISLDMPAEPPSAPAPPPKKPAAGPMKTLVINAQALADADLRAAEQKLAAPTTVEIPAPVASAPVTVEIPAPDAAPAPRPSKRASLLDIAFDFGEVGLEAPKPVPAEPVLSAEAAEYGFADVGAGAESAMLIEPTDISEPPSLSDAVGGLELAEFSSEASPLEGLESTEFLGGQDAPPLAGLASAADVEPPSASIEVELTYLEEAPPAPAPAVAEAPSPVASAPADDTPIVSFDDLDVSPAEDQTPLPTLEPPSGPRHVPRMTKSAMSSIPLLADFGLEDDDPTAPIAAPEPAAAPVAEPEPRKAQPTPTFVTETMAALYIKQGFRNEAIEVYRQLIKQDPTDAGMKEKLAALERQEHGLPEFEAPEPDAPEPTPAPANAALAEVSFADVGLSTPAPKRTPTPAAAAPAVPAGPSAREFFSGFARRSVAVSAVAVAAAPVAAMVAPTAAVEESEPEAAPTAASGWPLDTIFGAAHEVKDLHAAEVLAGIATFEGPSGGSGLDELFAAGTASTASVPAPKATTAASARVVPRASESLKFDQFFAAPGAKAPAAPAAPDAAAPAAAGDDDLDKFQGWLKGLKP